MAKYLVLVELDTEKTLLTEDVAAIGAVGEHVTVERAVNLDSLERIEGVQVWEADEDDAGDPLPTVSIIQDKFRAGQYVNVILLPGDRPKTLHLTAIIRKEDT